MCDTIIDIQLRRKDEDFPSDPLTVAGSSTLSESQYNYTHMFLCRKVKSGII